jgi:hypothetical protein
LKYLLTISILFSTFGLSAQNYRHIGVDDYPILNQNEVILLNKLLQQQNDGYDFTGKKVAFITASNGSRIVTKSDYFKNSVIPWIEKDSEPQIFMVRLSENEKVKSGGYDVLVFSWVKAYSKKRLIKQLDAIK